MLPIGPLMIEHRLIERMIKTIEHETRRIGKSNQVDSGFIEKAVDFIRTYADRCHHGKEEDILFRELGKKNMSADHNRLMKELVEDHKLGRKTTSKLVEAHKKYEQGDKAAISTINDSLKSLVEFYPKHIEKEDKHFFIPVMKYFNKDEQNAMLKEGYEFDQKLIHERYRRLVNELEAAYHNVDT